MPITGFAYSTEETLRVDDDSGGALDEGLDDDGGDLRRVLIEGLIDETCTG
jgi:hypothetical protein